LILFITLYDFFTTLSFSLGEILSIEMVTKRYFIFLLIEKDKRTEVKVEASHNNKAVKATESKQISRINHMV